MLPTLPAAAVAADADAMSCGPFFALAARAMRPGTRLRVARTGGVRAASTTSAAPTPAPVPTSPSSLFELRTYQLQAQHMSDYLALTGSSAFQPRLDASRLVGFWIVEMGGTLNAVVHLWAYDDLEHRVRVRTALAGNATFQAYLSRIRPWLVSQHSELTLGTLHLPPPAAPAGSRPGAFLLESRPGTRASTIATNALAPTASATLVAALVTAIGAPGRSVHLWRGDRAADLLPSASDLASSGPIAVGSATQRLLLLPTAFSPMQ